MDDKGCKDKSGGKMRRSVEERAEQEIAKKEKKSECYHGDESTSDAELATKEEISKVFSKCEGFQDAKTLVECEGLLEGALYKVRKRKEKRKKERKKKGEIYLCKTIAVMMSPLQM